MCAIGMMQLSQEKDIFNSFDRGRAAGRNQRGADMCDHDPPS